ncbi:hypothetical protein OPV22_010335 [Ensete ventricosum]|uniref:t-SNARE coiled-coil homology domain-containing protein n=1 Tax=Ensete ventricosum TaxID=4639 RepID=A0AAV8RL00_ENSVE|nr:hypothetical protein OPV22_010335 [Ensete ventricosum]
MTTRNRTPLYKKYRDALRSVRVPVASCSPSHAGPSSSASSSSSAGRGGPVIEMVSTSLLHPNRSYAPVSTEDPGNSSRGHLMVGLPPAWVDLSEEISANMQRAQTKISELVKVHEKALMPSFGDGKEDQHTIEVLTQEITDLLKRSEKRLMKLSPSGPSEESNVRRNVQGQDGLDFDMNINGTVSNMEDDEFVDVGFSEHQMSQLKRTEAFTREREREIAQVVESVNELAQIMKDLSVLVIDQGTIIDRIEYNIQNVASTVEEGYKQLQKVLSVCRENTEKRRNGYVCYHPCDNVLHYASPPNTKGDILLTKTILKR